MRILVTANQTPFIQGGADYHMQGFVHALRQSDHEVELLRLPFKFQPYADLHRSMQFAEAWDASRPNGVSIDRVISLQFPLYGVQHPDHWIWVMHQHRAVYDLYPHEASAELQDLRLAVKAFDERHLGQAKALFANSQNVAQRLARYNQLEAKVLYHPPPLMERYHCAQAGPYVFYPSRVESLKRQFLLLQAASLMQSDLKIVIAGEGGQLSALQSELIRLRLQDRVLLTGRISEAQKIAWYAHAQAVCFLPIDEDYGYITFETFLSSKPVLTCSDSGGPLEFIRHEENGWVEEADPLAIAQRLDWLSAHPEAVRKMGLIARETYDDHQITWQGVVDALTAQQP